VPHIAMFSIGAHGHVNPSPPGALRDAVLRLAGSPEVAAHCVALRDELRAAGGATRAADIIEAALR
jgi:macrolide glycosyltransferase